MTFEEPSPTAQTQPLSAQLDVLLVCVGIEEVMAWMDLHVHRGGEKKHIAQDRREVVWPAGGDKAVGPCAELALEEALPAWTSKARGPLLPSHPLAWVPEVCLSAIAGSPLHESVLQDNPWQRDQSPVAQDGGRSWGISIFLDFSPVFFFSFCHICVLFSLISNVSQHIMFSEVFKTDWEMPLEAMFYSTVCVLVYCQIKIKMWSGGVGLLLSGFLYRGKKVGGS